MDRQERVLPLEGVHNFRDYGGYPVAGGGRLRRGALWRSGQHHGATDADLARIDALGLASVFDLRSSRERETHPCRRPAGFSARLHLSADPAPKPDPAAAQATAAAPHVAAAQAIRGRDVASTRDGMRRNYHLIAFRPELIAMTRTMLAELARGGGPSLVNCMAGKDRTGIAVAMVHCALGVHRDDVIEDYVLTNSAGDVEARIAAGAETIRAMSGEVDPEIVRVLMGVEPEYLESALDAVAERYGTLDRYLETELGADGALREQLRKTLIEQG